MKCKWCGTNDTNPPEFNNSCGDKCYNAACEADNDNAARNLQVAAAMLQAMSRTSSSRRTSSRGNWFGERGVEAALTMGISELF